MLRTVELTTLTAAGSSVSNDVIAGEMLGAYVSYEGAGTMTLTTQHAPVVTFLTLATGGTQWYYPRGTCSTTGAAAIGYGSGYPAETVIPFVDNLAMTTNSTGTASATLVVRV
jgi:hypothetical protein